MPTIVQRYQIASYLGENAAGSDSQVYNLMGTGFTDLNEAPNAETKEKLYINDKAKTTTISKYGASWGYTSDMIVSEKPIEQLWGVGRNQLTGSDAEFDYVQVELFQTAVSGAYPARKFVVSAEVTDFSPDETDMQVKGTLHQVGDFVDGMFNPTTKVFTENE